jgi:GNAT superfamily N-acetyltransferase
VGPPAAGIEAVVGFTGHAIVATAADPAQVVARARDAFGGCESPDFLRWLAGSTGWVSCLDATLVGRGTGEGSDLGRPDPDGDHPRVAHVRHLARTDLEIYGDDRGVVILSRGLAGRRELSVEAEPDGQGRGWGRSLVRDALALVPAGEAVFAGVSPGNARSMRMFAALGFTPVGSEILLRPERTPPS